MKNQHYRLNPTTLAKELDLGWDRGPGAQYLDCEFFWVLLENKYWKERNKRLLQESA